MRAEFLGEHPGVLWVQEKYRLWLTYLSCIARRPVTELRTVVRPALVPSWCGCPSAKQRGRTKGAASCPASLLCPPLHSPANRVPGLKMVSLAILGSLCQQRHVDTATAVICSVVLAPAVGLRFSKAELKVWVNAGGCYGASIGL